MPPAHEPEPIPLIDLSAQHRPDRQELLAAIEAVADSQAFINGAAVSAFEQAFSEQHEGRAAIGVSSGTDALLVALDALGLGPGDEVITTPFTFIATAEAIARLGARPVFADVAEDSLLLDPQSVEASIGPHTRAILPVHLYGRACAMDRLGRLASERGLWLVEDCAQAMGASFAGRPVGVFGALSAFSFFPTKNLGGWGDAGMLLTGEAGLAIAARRICDHGARQRDDYVRRGGNHRLDTLQAAILLVKLKRFAGWLEQRREAARRYRDLFRQLAPDLLDGDRLQLPDFGPLGEHSFGLFVIQCRARDELRAHLDRAGIGSGVYYSRPLHLQACFAALGQGVGSCPRAERAATRVLALPHFPGIQPDQQQRVVEAIRDFWSSRVQA